MMKPRKGEEIGGGYFVMRRGKKTGRVGVSANTLPFEHPSLASALTEAKRLSEVNKGETYEVFVTTGFAEFCEKVEADDHG